jgi:hypothetical protein
MVAWIGQILTRSLAAAHAARIIHRDLKPIEERRERWLEVLKAGREMAAGGLDPGRSGGSGARLHASVFL